MTCPALIHCYVDHSRFLPMLTDKLPFPHEKPDSYHLPYTYGTHQLQYTFLAVFITLTHTPGKTTINWSTVPCTVFLVFILIDSTSKLRRSASFYSTPPFSEVTSYIFNTVKSLYHTLHSILGSLDFQMDFS